MWKNWCLQNWKKNKRKKDVCPPPKVDSNVERGGRGAHPSTFLTSNYRSCILSSTFLHTFPSFVHFPLFTLCPSPHYFPPKPWNFGLLPHLDPIYSFQHASRGVTLPFRVCEHTGNAHQYKSSCKVQNKQTRWETCKTARGKMCCRPRCKPSAYSQPRRGRE